MSEVKVGTVSHYYGAIGVAGIELQDELKVGDTVHIVGHTTDFTQTVDSMQIDHEPVETAGRGDSIGVALVERARVNDEVYRVDG